MTCATVRVRCELRGPESAVRVRQIRVLSPPVLQRGCAWSPSQVLHGLSEADTLKVFRLLTSQASIIKIPYDINTRLKFHMTICFS